MAHFAAPSAGPPHGGFQRNRHTARPVPTTASPRPRRCTRAGRSAPVPQAGATQAPGTPQGGPARPQGRLLVREILKKTGIVCLFRLHAPESDLTKPLAWSTVRVGRVSASSPQPRGGERQTPGRRRIRLGPGLSRMPERLPGYKRPRLRRTCLMGYGDQSARRHGPMSGGSATLGLKAAVSATRPERANP